jgi:hypothetical protein
MLDVITLPETLDEAIEVIRDFGHHGWTRERYEEAVKASPSAPSAIAKAAATEARIIGVDGAVGLFTAWLVVSHDAAKRTKK